MAGTELIEMTADTADKNKIDLMEVKTKDGMTLTWEGDAAVGTDIFIILEDGSQAPLADGEYELEDGSKIVAQGGKVAELIPAEAPEAEADMAEAEAVAPATTDVLAEVMPIFEELRGIIAELSTRLDKLENVETTEEEATAGAESLSKIAELENRIELLSSMAGAPSIVKKDDNTIKREAKEAAIVSRIEALKSTKR